RRRPAEVLVVAASAGAVVVLTVPWLPTLLYQARYTAAPWAVSPSFGSLIVDPAGTLGGGVVVAAIVVPVLAVAAAVNFVVTRRDGVQPALAAGAIGLTTLLGGWCLAQIE